MKIAEPLPQTVDGKNPRRCQQEHWHAAEQKVFDAIAAVNELGQDPVLTQAITALGQAKERVSDYLEGAFLEEPAPGSTDA